MAEQMKRLFGPVAVPTATGAITGATVPAGKRWIIRDLNLANTGNAARTCTLGIGGTAAAQAFLPGSSIASGSVYQRTGAIVLEAGESVHGVASGAGLTIMASGVEEDA